MVAKTKAIRKKNATNRKGRFRSVFERRIADELYRREVKYDYELQTYVWYDNSGRNKLVCPNCGEVAGTVKRHYTPDFFLRGSGIVMEAKGRLTSEDRKKLVAVSKRYPELDIRILYQEDAFIRTSANKRSAKGERYTEWAARHGIKSAVAGRDGKGIPVEWTN